MTKTTERQVFPSDTDGKRKKKQKIKWILSLVWLHQLFLTEKTITDSLYPTDIQNNSDDYC